ncbi:hypothetical protein N7509_011274 [Penicillium cosmopolitanum]|uniref:Ketoreductase domain-containing protein n=1 Tax=Penicillium cosmopolitanum TaxID=1131564 RepID=A0A9W9VSX1_9EURO|nr:uncharacterized protein N7509_011274 [Penicillium cosmopolitanum]KAJ5388733.1 hypothetical protein N7509_011274 [Penicillium cosmopolitanum]
MTTSLLPARVFAPSSSSIFAHSMNDIRKGCLSVTPRTRDHRFFSSSRSVQTSAATRFQSANRLAGRTCMVTGGSSGIGYAIAERFLQEGASSIILVGRSQKRLQDAADNLNASTGVSPDANATITTGELNVQQDAPSRIRFLVGDIGEAASWMRELEKEMATVDVLVNAAGISISSILPRSELADISQILRTNLEGAVLTSRALIRAAIRSRVRTRKNDSTDANPLSKCIINVSSLLALKAGTGAVPYAASKAGVLGLTRSVAVEAAASLKDLAIRSNAIVPGYIETPMIAGDYSLAIPGGNESY